MRFNFSGSVVCSGVVRSENIVVNIARHGSLQHSPSYRSTMQHSPWRSREVWGNAIRNSSGVHFRQYWLAGWDEALQCFSCPDSLCQNAVSRRLDVLIALRLQRLVTVRRGTPQCISHGDLSAPMCGPGTSRSPSCRGLLPSMPCAAAERIASILCGGSSCIPTVSHCRFPAEFRHIDRAFCAFGPSDVSLVDLGLYRALFRKSCLRSGAAGFELQHGMGRRADYAVVERL